MAALAGAASARLPPAGGLPDRRGRRQRVRRSFASSTTSSRAGLFTIGIASRRRTATSCKRRPRPAAARSPTSSSSHEVGDRMASLLAKLEHPVLTDIRVDWPSATAAEVSMSVLADLYARRRQRQDSSPSGLDTSTAFRCPISPGRASSRGIAIPISVSWHVSRMASSSMPRIKRRREPIPCDGDRSRGCAKGPH